MAEDRRQGPAHVPKERRASVTAVLRALRARGDLRSTHVGLVAQELGVGRRTVWRWLEAAPVADPHPRRRVRCEMTEEDIEELAYWNGNVAAFHRARPDGPSVDTIRRAVARALSPGQRAGLVGGERVRQRFDTFLTRPPQHRNQCWEADHCELAVEVLLPDGQVAKPWLTSYADRFSHGICGWAISGYPSEESVIAALRAAILTEPPFGPIGSIPSCIRWDRGKEFLAHSIGDVARALAVDARALLAYTAHLKGVIERWHESLETLLLSELPGFMHGPQTKTGHRVDDGAPVLTLDAFIELFARFVNWYNTDRPHAGLDGATPLARWNSDATPLIELPRAQLNHMLLAREHRIVTKSGIRLDGRRYNAAELIGWVGQEVEVRHMPHHYDSVEVFLRESHLCTAFLVDTMEEQEMKRILAKRSEEARWLARQQHNSARRRREKFAAITEARPAAVLGKVPEPVRRLTPSRSLIDHGEIPSDWVRPLDLKKLPDFVDSERGADD
jgi:putative transposase